MLMSYLRAAMHRARCETLTIAANRALAEEG
jgi:hypothetical protein